MAALANAVGRFVRPPKVFDGYTDLAAAILDALSPDDARAIASALPGTLDAAWAEVEAALPEGWHVFEVVKQSDASWLAVAGRRDYLWNGPNSEAGSGPTPAAALLALAEKLREAGR